MPAPLPVVTVPFLEAITAPLVQGGTPVDKFLDMCAIPRPVLERPEGVFSELALWNFEELVSRTEGFDNLGYVAATGVLNRETGSFCRVPIPKTEFLYQLLDQLSCQISNHSNYANHRLEWSSRGAWYLFNNQKLVTKLPWQVEQFVIGMIVAIVRTADPAWNPSRLLLTNHSGNFRTHADWQNAQIFWSQPLTGVFIEHKLLFQGAGSVSETAPQIPAIDSDLALLELVAAYVLANTATLQNVADAFRITPRTLQRALAARGLQFRSLKLKATMMLAMELLDDEKLGIGEIARKLGYVDHADFTHAFKRQSRLSPSKWREYQHGTANSTVEMQIDR